MAAEEVNGLTERERGRLVAGKEERDDLVAELDVVHHAV